MNDEFQYRHSVEAKFKNNQEIILTFQSILVEFSLTLLIITYASLVRTVVVRVSYNATVTQVHTEKC